MENDDRKDLLLGIIMGQISELLNSIQRTELDSAQIYKGLLDIHNMASLQIHAIYYKKKRHCC